MLTYLWIGLGSAIGGMARYWCSAFAIANAGATFPWGTLAVNILGSSFIGFFATLTGPDGRMLVGSSARNFVMAGVCGGFTTFSAFSLETLSLARGGDWLKAVGNIVLSLGLCLAGVWTGHTLATMLNQAKRF